MAQSYECPTATARQETVCNLAETRASNTAEIGYDTGAMLNNAYATSFTAGNADHGYRLRSVHIMQGSILGEPGDLTFALHAATSGGGVGAEIEVLGGGNPTPSTLHEFTSAGASLVAGATYWLVASAPGAPTSGSAEVNYNFIMTESRNQAGDTGWSIGDNVRLRQGSGGFQPINIRTFAFSMAVIADIADAAPAAAPRGVSATPNADGTTITVEWSAPSDATRTGYEICVVEAAPDLDINVACDAASTATGRAGVGVYSEAGDLDTLRHERTGLDAETDYAVAVRSLGVHGDGRWVSTDLKLKLRVFLESALP